MELSGVLAALNLALDVTCLAGAVYAVIAGTTKPSFPSADKTQKAKAEDAPAASSSKEAAPSKPDSDFISTYGLTKIERIFHAFIILAAAWHLEPLVWRQGVHLQTWVASGDRGRFRLACLLAAIGGAGRLWTYRELGHYFTFDLQVQKGQKIINTGPYAFVRHPSYTAILVMMVGIGLAIGPYGPGTPAALRLPFMGTVGVSFVSTVLLIRKRCDDEERMFLLEEDTGKLYFEYMKKVGHRLWPNVY